MDSTIPTFVKIGGALVATSHIVACYIGTSDTPVPEGICGAVIYTRLATGFVLKTLADTQEEIDIAFATLCRVLGSEN